MVNLENNQPKKKALNVFHEEIAEARAKIPLSLIFRNNFIGDLAWGFGTVMGATVLVGIIAYAFSLYGDIPIIGNLIGIIARAVEQGLTKLPR